ncbi:MAG: hypothetical protein ACJ76F_13055 [Bacteroidia bacterium]
MYTLRFFISWILGAVLMYSAFYFWHGIVLTDLSRITYSHSLFLVFAAITYLAISFVVYKVFNLKMWNKVSRNLFLKALLTGVSVGFLLFVVTTVLGISFSMRHSLTYMLTDCIWQVVEQSLGAVIMALAHLFIYVPDFSEE